MSSASCDGFANPNSDGIGRIFRRVAMNLIGIGEQIATFIGSLPVIEGLVMRKMHCRIEDVDHAGHVLVDQANQFVVTRSRENHIECPWGDQRWGADAG